MNSIRLTEQPIHLSHLLSEVESVQAGAIVTFCGNVRDSDLERAVARLEYEIHPSTEHTLRELVEEIASRHPILASSVAHRYGEIQLGESALIVAVAAAHRAEAFAACAEIVEEIKTKIPIWKHQIFADGSDEWVHSA